MYMYMYLLLLIPADFGHLALGYRVQIAVIIFCQLVGPSVVYLYGFR